MYNEDWLNDVHGGMPKYEEKILSRATVHHDSKKNIYIYMSDLKSNLCDRNKRLATNILNNRMAPQI